ncbi:hypothetical protein [Streptomyces sp. GESEQ-35]|uniref:hypothetical protein n=1 Tax=Streptomyces sp. GESEQ-35 TaxID=2812657 RepID=UPI001B33B877|nr:hypothetical protein [Streptomyces sp. GESEQ-35]
MCISTGEAAFSGTIVYCGRQHHPVHGLIHVLGYQNTAANLADGPNAMLLHLPTRQLTPRHFLSAGRTGDVLHRMVAAVESAAAAADDIAWMSTEPQPVQVFDHDIYTVLLAADPTAVTAALRQVPPHRRPDLDPDLLRFYADHFPDHTIAVCCFDNADAQRAKPLLLWYAPSNGSNSVSSTEGLFRGGWPTCAVACPHARPGRLRPRSCWARRRHTQRQGRAWHALDIRTR